MDNFVKSSKKTLAAYEEPSFIKNRKNWKKRKEFARGGGGRQRDTRTRCCVRFRFFFRNEFVFLDFQNHDYVQSFVLCSDCTCIPPLSQLGARAFRYNKILLFFRILIMYKVCSLLGLQCIPSLSPS